MFSATMGKDIDKLALVTTKKPIRISANPDNVLKNLFRKQLKNYINKL
jgi:superfamily II DNA/RNA helicase